MWNSDYRVLFRSGIIVNSIMGSYSIPRVVAGKESDYTPGTGRFPAAENTRQYRPDQNTHEFVLSIMLVTICFLVSSLNVTAQTSPAAQDPGSVTAADLLEAAREGDIQSVRDILNSGLDTNAANNNGTTALMAASEHGHPEIISVLLEKGARINAKTGNDMTALMYASEKGHAGIVNALIENGAEVNNHSKDGFTALILAS